MQALETGELVYKPRSRTMQEWIAGCYNAVPGTQHQQLDADYFRLTREWCVLALNGKELSQPGDSGSVLLDEKFQPVGMIWGGRVVGPQDITYVSTLESVFRDVEQTLGWKEGSVSML